ncbi:MAG: pyruvate, phosphate dikinase, partial [candidate division Zixibacteria bacterium]|nr:pyruvate, phosphate dikinase [candidate division Zixibacteria bacterium]
CGEHGGDPASVEFCHRLGLDYVSCSPYRVPIARLAAAQAVIREGGKPKPMPKKVKAAPKKKATKKVAGQASEKKAKRATEKVAEKKTKPATKKTAKKAAKKPAEKKATAGKKKKK